MKTKILVLIIVISISAYFILTYDDYSILPKDANYKFVSRNMLYALTPHGLRNIGWIFDYDKQGERDRKMSYVKFNCATNMLYFSSIDANHNSPLRKININDNLSGRPETVPNTRYAGDFFISPNGKYLVCSYGGEDNDSISIRLLNLETQAVQIIDKIPNSNCYYSYSWLNNNQIIYCIKCDSFAKNISNIFDIHTMTKTKANIGTCTPGAVSPDGTKMLISCSNKNKNTTAIYDTKNGNITTIINHVIMADIAVWLPDGKGFLYNTRYWRDHLVTIEGVGLYYYSLEKKKSVRLASMSIDMRGDGGAFVPSSVQAKPYAIKKI